MERRNFLKLAIGVAAGAAAFSAAAQAAPLSPQSVGAAPLPHGNPEAQPAVASGAEAEALKPEQVHWHRHHRHWGWRRRHWGWHRRRWHRRHHW